MKVAFAFATALILCVALLGPIQARFEKPKYCVGKNGKHYLRGEHYDDKVKGTCIRYTCVRKGKKLKMAKKKVPCAVEPEPSLKANVTALEAKLEALQNSVESILVMMTALQSTSSQLEINMTSNIAAININKEAITTNTEGISVHDDAISSNTDVISSNQAGISVNKDSCSAVQITADKLKTCLGDVTSKECPISQNGKVAVIDAIIENEDDIEALESLHDNKGCCTPTTISTTTTPPTTTPPTTTPAGVVGDWSSWSDCSATCGNATKTRTRSCQISPCQPFVKEETVTCHLPQCNDDGPIEKCFYEDTKITFHDLGLNQHNQNQKPDWILSDKGRTLNSLLNTRPSAGLTNLGKPSDPVSFSGRVFSTAGDDDVMGMVFGYWNETNFFVVASSREFGPTNWYVGRLHATCGHSCASEKTISDAIWSPQDHPEDITVLATGSTYWQHNEKYNFTICFNPSKLLLNVNVTLEDGVDPILQTGTISAKTNDSEVDDISRQGGFIGVYVDSQADTTWDNLDCHECGLDEFGTTDTTSTTPTNLVVTGGYGSSRALATSEVISPEGVCSEGIPQLPLALRLHASVFFIDQLMVCGGYTSTYQKKCYFLKDNNSTSWVDGPSLNIPRAWFTLTKVGDEVFAVGGEGFGGDLDTIEKLSGNPAQWSILEKKMTTIRELHCTVYWEKNNSLVIIGGNYLVNIAQSFNLITGEWSDLAQIPVLRELACSVYEDTIVVTGGWGRAAGQDNKKIYMYKEENWETIGEMNGPRKYHTMDVLDGKLLVIGGHGRDGIEQIHSNGTVHTLDFSLSGVRGQHSAAKVPAKKFPCHN